MEQEIRVSIMKGGKLYNLYNESDHITPPTNISSRRKLKPESELSACVVGGYYKDQLIKKEDKVVNPEVIKDLYPKFEKAVAIEGKEPVDNSVELLVQSVERNRAIISEKQTVSSPDISEEIVEVKQQNFPTHGQNSVIQDQDSELEKGYAREALEEQQELDNADKGKSTNRHRPNIDRYMGARLKDFQFHPTHTTKEKSDMIEFLIHALNVKYEFEPEFIVLLATEFVDGLGYVFEDVDESNLSKAEKLAIDCFGNDEYENEPTMQKIKSTKQKRRLNSDL